MLHDGFTRAERTRHRRHTALGDGEQRVDDALTRHERDIRRQLAAIGTPDTHRPRLHQRQRYIAVIGGDRVHRVRHRVVALGNGGDSAAHVVRQHNLVGHHGGFLYHTDRVAADHAVADRDGRSEVPVLVARQRRHLHAALQIGAAHLHDLRQRALDAVEDRADQTRSELHTQRFARGHHFLARSQSGCLLIHLNRRLVTVHFDDLTDQPFLADAYHVEHVRVPHAFRDDQRTGDLGDRSLRHITIPFDKGQSLLNMISEPTAFSTACFSHVRPTPLLPETPGRGTTDGVSCSSSF